jgi:hypothetical protein
MATELSSEHVGSYLVHRFLVVVGFAQVTIAIHRDLQAAMAGKSLHCLGLQIDLDPARDREMP